MNRTTFATLAAASLAALAHPRHARAQEPVPIKLATPTNDTATSALYALKSGLFRRAGLNVEILAMNSGGAVAAAVAGGAVQFGSSSLVTVIEAHAKRVPFTLVATSGMTDTNVPYSALVVRKDAPYRTARDLNGKTLATAALLDLAQIGTSNWIDKNGGDSSTVHFVEISAPASVPAIAEGRIDAGILGTPYLTQALESGTIRVFSKAFDAIAPRFIHIAWYTLEDYANTHRDIVDRFTHVMHDAAVYCNGHPAETAPLIVEFGKVDPKLASRMTRVVFPEYLTASLIQPLVDVVAKYKAIDKSFDAQELISPYALKPPQSQSR